MKFCDKLQKIRKENNITQEMLADKLGVSRQAVSKWESGDSYPDTEKLIQISKLFKISLDELINDNVDQNKTTNKKKFNFMEIFDMVFESVRKVWSMFFAMNFGEKIKFLLEMAFIALAIFLSATLVNEVILSIIRRIFAFLPYKLFNAIDYLSYTLLYIVWLIIGVMFFIRMLKVRYLDYYVIIKDDTIEKTITEEPIKELKDRKETKIVIRDPADSSSYIFKKIAKLFMFLFKCFCICLMLPVVFFFIFFLILLVFSLLYLFSGLFFNGISLAILGVICFCFILIRFLYNVIFNQKINYTRMFILFIISISFMGIGVGISFASLSTFEIENEIESEKNQTELSVDMKDNLIMFELMNIDENKIIIDDNLNDIKLTVNTYDKSIPIVYTYKTFNYQNDEHKNYEYEIVNININYDMLEQYKLIINNLKNKKINSLMINNDYEIAQIRLSSKNLTKIKENYQKYHD